MPTKKIVQAALAAARAIAVMALDFKSNATLHCIQACERSGLVDNETLRGYRAELAAMEVLRMTLLPPITPAQPVQARRINRVPRTEQLDFGPVWGIAVIATPWLVVGTALAFAYA